MPQLTNPKWEAFAKGLADGLKIMDAYVTAGYDRSPSAASQLKARPEIQSRVQELLAEKRAKGLSEADDIENLPSELNRSWLIKTLMKNVRLAQDAGQIAPANKAVEMLAEIIGISFKKPGGAAPGDDDEGGNSSNSAPLDMDKMSNAIGELGKLLPDDTKKDGEKK